MTTNLDLFSERHHAAVKSGRDFIKLIESKTEYRNPSIYEKLVQHLKINEKGWSTFRLLINCSRREAIIVNVCLFYAKFLLDRFLTFRVTFTSLTFCVLRDLKFSLIHNFKQLNSIGGNLILKVK